MEVRNARMVSMVSCALPSRASLHGHGEECSKKPTPQFPLTHHEWSFLIINKSHHHQSKIFNPLSSQDRGDLASNQAPPRAIRIPRLPPLDSSNRKILKSTFTALQAAARYSTSSAQNCAAAQVTATRNLLCSSLAVWQFRYAVACGLSLVACSCSVWALCRLICASDAVNLEWRLKLLEVPGQVLKDR